jgi:hypothetical protein
MAIFHLSTKIIGRSKNRSAVACASYRAGEQLHDERLGRSFKFKRQDRVAHTEIIAPASAPEWVSDRAKLWNSVEANERRKDAQLSREFQVALPHELPLRLQKELLNNWLREQVTPLGLVADIAIHRAPLGKVQNDHAHIMTTFRSIGADGSWSKTKDRTLNSPEQLEQWRASWAQHINDALNRAGYENDDDRKVDHRSHKRRGLEELPTIHEGYAAQGIEARGDRSWRVAVNREIHRQNRQFLAQIKARVMQAATSAMALAASAFADGFAQFGKGPGETAPKSTPKPAPPPVRQPPPMRPDKLEDEPPPVVADAEAEKRKKAAHLAAMRQLGGGGGIGG